jgi:hypothetical protein
LPLVKKLEERPALKLSRDRLPRAEVLETLVFVSAANTKYFQLLVELLESIKATEVYKEVPVCILDCGLTVDEKHLLF